MKMWSSVRRGEKLYISPFKDNADIQFDSSLPYEVGVLKGYVLPFCEQLTPEIERYEEIGHLLEAYPGSSPWMSPLWRRTPSSGSLSAAASTAAHEPARRGVSCRGGLEDESGKAKRTVERPVPGHPQVAQDLGQAAWTGAWRAGQAAGSAVRCARLRLRALNCRGPCGGRCAGLASWSTPLTPAPPPPAIPCRRLWRRPTASMRRWTSASGPWLRPGAVRFAVCVGRKTPGTAPTAPDAASLCAPDTARPVSCGRRPEETASGLLCRACAASLIL